MRADALLLPIGATVRRAAKDDGTSAHLATGEGWTLRAIEVPSGGATLAQLYALRSGTAEPASTVDDRVGCYL